MATLTNFRLNSYFFLGVAVWMAIITIAESSKHRETSTRKTTYFDLSYSINNDTIYYPGQKVDFSLSKDTAGYTPAGYWYATYSFCMGEHGGTHVDAPIHFNREGWTLNEIPPTHFIDVPATVVDVEEHVFEQEQSAAEVHLPNDKFLLQVEHLLDHESKHGEIPFGGVVLVHTGWGRYWPTKQKYLGWVITNSTVDKGEKPVLNFPGLSEDAARWLANERGIVGLGVDTPSVDIGDNRGNLPVHILFGKRNIYNIENVANLHLVIQSLKKNKKENSCHLHLFVMPIKITGATGGPTRILAYCKH